MEKKKLFIKAINFFWRLEMCNDTMVHCAVTLPPLPLSFFGSVCLPLVHVSPHLEWPLLNEIKECCQEEKWKIGHCLLGSIIRVITVCAVGSQDSSDPLSSHSETKNNNNTSTALDNCCVMKSLVLSSLGHHRRRSDSIITASSGWSCSFRTTAAVVTIIGYPRCCSCLIALNWISIKCLLLRDLLLISAQLN